ncbi:hypothetical protein B0H19DRAFT_1185208 [Mycena capillaripes]|nr:hypothetical protein B0H19DRAFT_1185208 [Mycena capillaripes]
MYIFAPLFHSPLLVLSFTFSTYNKSSMPLIQNFVITHYGVHFYVGIEECMSFVDEHHGAVAELELVVTWNLRRFEEVDVAHHFANFRELRGGNRQSEYG